MAGSDLRNRILGAEMKRDVGKDGDKDAMVTPYCVYLCKRLRNEKKSDEAVIRLVTS